MNTKDWIKFSEQAIRMVERKSYSMGTDDRFTLRAKIG
jgi:hypothetical protein